MYHSTGVRVRKLDHRQALPGDLSVRPEMSSRTGQQVHGPGSTRKILLSIVNTAVAVPLQTPGGEKGTALQQKKCHGSRGSWTYTLNTLISNLRHYFFRLGELTSLLQAGGGEPQNGVKAGPEY